MIVRPSPIKATLSMPDGFSCDLVGRKRHLKLRKRELLQWPIPGLLQDRMWARILWPQKEVYAWRHNAIQGQNNTCDAFRIRHIKHNDSHCRKFCLSFVVEIETVEHSKSTEFDKQNSQVPVLQNNHLEIKNSINFQKCWNVVPKFLESANSFVTKECSGVQP